MPARPLSCAGGVSITSPLCQVLSVIFRQLYVTAMFVYTNATLGCDSLRQTMLPPELLSSDTTMAAGSTDEVFHPEVVPNERQKILSDRIGNNGEIELMSPGGTPGRSSWIDVTHLTVSLELSQAPFAPARCGLDDDETVVSHGHAIQHATGWTYTVTWLRRITV